MASTRIPVQKTQEAKIFYDFSALSIECIVEKITLSNLNNIFLESDVNIQLEILENNLLEILQLVPQRRFILRPEISLLKSREAIFAKSQRDLAYTAYLNDKTEEKWKIFCKYRNRLKTVLRNLNRKKSYRMFASRNTKQVWNTLRNAGINEECDQTEITDINALNEYFLSHRTTSTSTTNVMSEHTRSNEFSFRNVTLDELAVAFSKIKSNAIGHDNIPLKLIKIVFPYIAKFLLHIMNTMLTSSTFPDRWKTARVVPIKKSGSANDFSNMRPISILPILSKIAENLIKLQVVEYFDASSLIDDSQAAYRNRYNSTYLLISLTDSIREAVSPSSFCVLVSLDSTKAFDSIDPLLLDQKLFLRYRFSKSACALISSYMTGRKQFVSFNGSSSSVVDTYGGVPQGSILGPILFMAYVNDFVDCLDRTTCKPFIFADDIQLLFLGDVRFLESAEAFINRRLVDVQCWMNRNALKLNSSKTKAMLFTSPRTPEFNLRLSIQNEIVEFVPKLKCLGVWIDNKLNFESHINHLHSSIRFTIKRLYCLNITLPLRIKQNLAYSLLLSRLLYGLEVFSGTSRANFEKIKFLFNSVTRYVYNIFLYDHVSEKTRELLSCSVHDFIKQRLIFSFYKIILTHTPRSIAEKFTFSRSLRNPQLIPPIISSTLFQNSYLVRVVRLWNDLPRDF